MKMTKRILSFVLCLAMIVGIIPMSVFAVDEVVLDAAIFCSDVHGSTSDLSSVLAGVKTSGVDYSSIGFVGDTCLTVANTTSTVQSALGDTDIAVMFSYASSHDKENSADIATNWNYSGEVEGVSDYYLVYTIRETDMQTASAAATAAKSFTTWYNGLTTAEKQLPIFIMSHRPMHERREGCDGGAEWYNVISAAAESSDIVFFWGHNHTGETSVDTDAYYVAKDGTEYVKITNGESVIPNFTYMNAGYINANGQNPARKGIATTVQITASSLIFQDYNSSGEYSGTYAHNVTVEREFAATKEAVSIDVTGTTRYTVGGNSLALKVTATYDDGTTAVVTDDCTFTGVNLTKSGKYTLTATYGDLTDTLDVVVAAYGEDESTIISVEVVSTGVTAVEVTNVYGEPDLSDSFEDYVACDIALTDYTTGNKIEYTMRIPADMDTTNLGLYHVATVDGKTVLTPVEFTVVNECIVFTSTLTGTFAYGAITVPDGYELYSIEASNYTKDYFVGDSLDITSPFMVTATYKKVDSDDFIRVISVYEENNNPDGYTVDMDSFDMATAGTYNVKLSYTYEGVTCETTFPITVWGKTFTGSDVTVTVGSHGVASVTMTDVSAASNVTAAVGALLNSYNAYDIVPELAENYELTGTATVKMPAPANADVVYYFNETTGALTKMEDATFADGYVTFTTDHFSIYVVGETSEADEETLTLGSDETKTVYVLVSTPTAGNQYIIVSTGTAGPGYALKENTTTGTSVTINAAGNGVSAPYIENSDNTIVWTASSGMNFKSVNGGYYLNYSESKGSYSLSFSTSNASDWTVDTNALYRKGSKNNYYLRYNNGWTMGGKGTEYNVYFYEKQTVTVSAKTEYEVSAEDIEFIYPTSTSTDAEGNATTTLVTTTGAALTYELLANGKAVSFDGEVWTVAVVSDANGIIDTDKSTNSTLYFTGNVGEARVRIYCTFTVDGTEYKIWDTITVKATAPYYSIQLHKAELTKVDITAFTDGVTYYTYNSTTNTYQVAESYVEGTTYYTTPVVKGAEITGPIALKGIEAGDTYSVWAVVKEYTNANPDGGDMGALGNALTWKVSDESIATIDTTTGVITFTGNNYGTFTVTVSYKGADGKVITDTITISVTDSLYTVPGDGTNDFPEYPNEGAVRFDKTATSVGNYSETGIAKVELSMTGRPYGTTVKTDVVIMVDMTASMSDDDVTAAEAAVKELIKSVVYDEENDKYDSNIQIFVDVFYSASSDSAFETENYLNGTTISSAAELTAAQALIDFTQSSSGGGTRYNLAMKDVYETLNRDGHAENQFVVFVSDGVPTAYAPLTDGDVGTTITGSNSVTSSLAAGWFDDTGAVTDEFKTEYYSYKIKSAGIPVYTVGCNLTALSDPADVLNHMSSNYSPDGKTATGETKYSFFCTTSGGITDEVLEIFKGIGADIKEAATDVVVEDKIGNDYTINFGLPGYGTANALDSTALDGLSNFYIQIVEYVLDETTHQRTNEYTVLENFTFNLDGTLKSHTIGSVTCTDCNHVTTNKDGVITAIDGTYFDYKSDSTGEYLTWTAEKISTTELTLQYFAYLDNSSGVATGDQVPAGTYYTNEYATLTYTNFQGNRVQQEFPVPQMTWNGAQVSYVFYLVNEQGQPVNRAGKVVPIAEAVFVTSVYTYSIIWNDLEQAAGLEAKYLADKLLPDAYELYDDDASYFIHVYEKESKVNLNNHFVIGSDVTDDYNTVTHSWTNAETTYVFNNWADTTKYNDAGVYIANDGKDNTTSTTYLCKGEGTISGVAWTEVTLSNDSDLVNGAYYYDVDGVKTRVLVYTEGVTYYQLTAATYTAKDGETQWVPGENDSTTGGTVINGYIYYVDEKGQVYTIVQKENGTETYKGFDFANTTVAFAVVWKPQLAEDTVVIDFGLDVVVDVTTNDAMAAGVVGVRGEAPSGITINSGIYDATKGTSVDLYIGELKIGTATVENLTSVRFSLDKTNGMQFTVPVVFYYEVDVNYYKPGETTVTTTSMYSKVTIIPATTVYYEDSFVTLESYSVKYADNGTPTSTKDETTEWTTEGTTINGTQAQDRPGASKISAALDADNNYGYDAAYKSMSTHSMGSAAKISVTENIRGEATFTFYGTGFDVISLTSNTTGTLIVQLYEGASATGTAKKSQVVDTYYGMNADGTISVNNPAALYQIPVMKMSGLAYGQYTVKIIASYMDFFNHTSTEGGYDLYLDAIRIYDPTGNQNDTANGAYVQDGEGWPVYEELRNNIIGASNYTVTENEDGTVTVTGDDLSGAIFIDSDDATTSIQDYVSYGPNNELYLANNQAIAFKVNAPENLADIQLGIKVANGNSVTYEINGDSYTVNTTTDMYYSVLNYAKAGVVVIKNVSGGILSLTNIKVTHTSAPAAESGISLLSMDGESAGVALMMLRRAPVVEDVPEETVPEESVPEETVPEESVPEETVPEETVPEETVPEETVPEETVPEETVPEETVPEETVPEETVPEETEPGKDTNSKPGKNGLKEAIIGLIGAILGWLFG